jgi:co-chaperonin GroES (HSP10)
MSIHSQLGLLPTQLSSPEAFNPLGDQILVKVKPAEERSGSIHIPEAYQRAGATGGCKFLRRGTVIRVGPGDKLPSGRRRPMGVAVGDLIVYDHPSNREVDINGELYVILHEEQHVVGVEDPE